MADSPALLRYVEEAKLEELASELQARGYEVTRNAPIGDLRADLIARRGGETVVFEVTTAQSLRSSHEAVKKVAQRATRMPNTEFRLVVANPPADRTIEVVGIEKALTDFLIERPPRGLDELATHASVENVSDVELDEIHVSPETIQVAGSGLLGIYLQYGSSSDLERGDGDQFTETVPFEFDVTLDWTLAITKVQRLDADFSFLHVDQDTGEG